MADFSVNGKNIQLANIDFANKGKIPTSADGKVDFGIKGLSMNNNGSQEIDFLKANKDSSTQQQTATKADLQAANQQVSDLQSKISGLEKPQKGSGENADAEYDKAMKEYESKINDLQAKLEELKAKAESLQAQDKELADKIGQLDTQIQQKENELNQTKMDDMFSGAAQQEKDDQAAYETALEKGDKALNKYVKEQEKAYANREVNSEGTIAGRTADTKIEDKQGRLDGSIRLTGKNLEKALNDTPVGGNIQEVRGDHVLLKDGTFAAVNVGKDGTVHLTRTDNQKGESQTLELTSKKGQINRYEPDENGNLNKQQATELAKEMLENGNKANVFGFSKTGNAAFDALPREARMSVINMMDKMQKVEGGQANAENSSAPKPGVGIKKEPNTEPVNTTEAPKPGEGIKKEPNNVETAKTNEPEQASELAQKHGKYLGENNLDDVTPKQVEKLEQAGLKDEYAKVRANGSNITPEQFIEDSKKAGSAEGANAPTETGNKT